MPKTKKGKFANKGRRTGKRTNKGKIPSQMVMKTYKFKRDLEQTLSLSGSAAPDGWTLDGTNRVYRNFGWSLGSLGATSAGDIQNLFKLYRIKGARVRLYFSNTISGTEQDSTHSNSQIMVRMAVNQRGENNVLNDAFWQQAQAKKYKLAINGGKPLDIYMPLKQPNVVYSSTGGQAPSLMSPKFIQTSVSNIVHYGLSLSIERVDGQGFTAGFGNTQYCKVITTLYLETKGVS